VNTPGPLSPLPQGFLTLRQTSWLAEELTPGRRSTKFIPLFDLGMPVAESQACTYTHQPVIITVFRMDIYIQYIGGIINLQFSLPNLAVASQHGLVPFPLPR